MSLSFRVIFAFAIFVTILASSDLFTSTENLKVLSENENKAVDVLESYLEILRQNTQDLRWRLEQMKTSVLDQRDRKQVFDYSRFNSFLEAYFIITRWANLTEVFQPLEKLKARLEEFSCFDENVYCPQWATSGECMKNPTYMHQYCQRSCGLCKSLPQVDYRLVEIISKYTKRRQPTEDDYFGSALGLIRLIRTFDLDIDSLCEGNVYEFKSIRGLETQDFIAMGRAALRAQETGYAGQLFKKAVSSGTRRGEEVWRAEAAIALANLYITRNDLVRAKKLVKEILHDCVDYDERCHDIVAAKGCSRKIPDLETRCRYSCDLCTPPHDAHAYENFATKLAPLLKDVDDTSASDLNDFTDERTVPSSRTWQNAYEELCRGEYPVKWRGYCWYRPTAIPILTFKEEVLSSDPRIAMIYDVISDQEAETIIRISKGQLSRAAVGTERSVSDVRISKLTWLTDTDDFVVKLSKRVELITGLVSITRPTAGNTDKASSDAFQVVNYGLGGHYEPHVDFFEHILNSPPSDIKDTVTKSGDRICTFLFYLTDVIAGGSTAFPTAGIQVAPVKHAAAFWFNNNLAGEYDQRTLHAGCPVLIGEKWVINKWIREYGNEFSRRCGLDPDAVSKTGL